MLSVGRIFIRSINRIPQITKLASVLEENREILAEHVKNKTCGLACLHIKDILEKKGWKVKEYTHHFEDYLGLIEGSNGLTMFHKFLIVSRNRECYLVDPTIGQFLNNSRIYFVHEISYFDADKCIRELKALNLRNDLISVFATLIVSLIN